jgi:hypothetical protein
MWKEIESRVVLWGGGGGGGGGPPHSHNEASTSCSISRL